MKNETHILEAQSEPYKSIIKDILQTVFIKRQMGAFLYRCRQFLDFLALQILYLQKES